MDFKESHGNRAPRKVVSNALPACVECVSFARASLAVANDGGLDSINHQQIGA